MDDQVIWRLVGVLIGVSVTTILGFVLKEAKAGTTVAKCLEKEMIALKTTTFPMVEGNALKERMAVLENDHKHSLKAVEALTQSIKELNSHLVDLKQNNRLK